MSVISNLIKFDKYLQQKEFKNSFYVRNKAIYYSMLIENSGKLKKTQLSSLR